MREDGRPLAEICPFPHELEVGFIFHLPLEVLVDAVYHEFLVAELLHDSRRDSRVAERINLPGNTRVGDCKRAINEAVASLDLADDGLEIAQGFVMLDPAASNKL